MTTSYLSALRPRAALAAVLLATLGLAACGGEGDPALAPTVTPPVVTPTPNPSEPGQPASAPQIRCAP